jgi:hypothetical protein
MPGGGVVPAGVVHTFAADIVETSLLCRYTIVLRELEERSRLMRNRIDGGTLGTLVLAMLVVAGGCSSGDPNDFTYDTSLDTAYDLTDGGTDPGVDPGTDPGVDPGTDPGVDPGTDPGVDPGTDPGVDPGTDPGVDPGTDPGTGGVVGDACYTTTDCSGVPGAGRACLTSLMGYITFPGGYCSAMCTSGADCGSGAACVNLMDYGDYCLKQCSSDGECRTGEGYSCEPVAGAPGSYCIPPISYPDGGVDY